MIIQEASDQSAWDSFLCSQPFSPFLQSWTMGEVYKDINQEPIRLEVRDGTNIVGICQAIVVPARRGKHLSVSYGPVLSSIDALDSLIAELKRIAKEKRCCFVRISPYWKAQSNEAKKLESQSKSSPLHMLGEHIWYLPIKDKTEQEILMGMRKTTRNLVRRAEREGVKVTASTNPLNDLDKFITLHEETRKRHHFTPYSNAFFRSQVEHFSKRDECTLYLAEYNNEIVASSVHMHGAGETSYHHGASTHKYPKIPASYLLQWTAIKDSLKREDHTYSFWGIAPEGVKKHPFAGVTTFKRGFGGELLELMHCRDIPLSPRYNATRVFETLRKWHRGF